MNSPNRTARIAGALYLMMLPCAVFSLIVRSKLIVPGDAATTANNIVASETLFRSSIIVWLIGQTVFIFLTLTLYRLLKSVHKVQAVFMVVLALVAVPIAFVNELHQFGALILTGGQDYLAAFDPDQLYAQVMVSLDLYEHGTNLAGIFWGLWLFPLGYLVFKSGFLPRILGILLMIGCLGYVIDSIVFLLAPDTGFEIAWYTFWGELLFPLWLVIKGVHVERWGKQALESTSV